MFISELTPLGQEFLQQPVAFIGGVFAGAFQLSLNEDPLKSWLAEQGAAGSPNAEPMGNDRNGGPQSIEID